MSSCLVLHMDKFRGGAVRGIQSHNQRERKSHSNPDIEPGKSGQNYDLHNEGRINYQKVINNRIDSLNLKKTPRHDAVQMCGIIISSNQEFFKNLTEVDQKFFFRSAKHWLANFVGPENVIATHVHLDEKTPHLHFCHVPITLDGRLCAKEIYTRNSLRKMQSELPKYLQSLGFEIERGVIQESGSAKKHLDTREFKQQQTALGNLRKESDLEATKLKNLKQKINNFEKLAAEAETILMEKPELPSPGLFKAQAIHEAATDIINLCKKSLADKQLVNQRNKFLEKSQATFDEQIRVIKEKAEQKAAKEIQRQSAMAKSREKELNDKLHKAVKMISQRDQTIEHLMADVQILLSKVSRLEKIEQEWLSHKQKEKIVEIMRQEKEMTQTPKRQSGQSMATESQPAPSLSPARSAKKPDQGWSR